MLRADEFDSDPVGERYGRCTGALPSVRRSRDGLARTVTARRASAKVSRAGRGAAARRCAAGTNSSSACRVLGAACGQPPAAPYTVTFRPRGRLRSSITRLTARSAGSGRPPPRR